MEIDFSDASRRTVNLPTCAKILGISRGTAYALAAEGKIPVIRLGKRMVVSKFALQKMLEEAGDGA